MVAYCPEEYVDRDIKKAVFMLGSAIPVHVRREEHGE